jgi:hypothetical protein
MERNRPHVKVGSSHDTAVRRGNSRVPGAAQHEAQRNDALQNRDRCSSWRSRISDAPLRIALALHRIRDMQARTCSSFHLTISNSPSCSRGAFFAPGVFHLCFAHPERGVGGAPRVVRVRARHPWGVPISAFTRVFDAMNAARQALARRLASHNAGRSPLGAPPWRFWASGPRFRLLRRPPPCNGGHLPSGSVQRAPRSQVVVPGGRGPGPPGANGYKPPPQDATPRSAFRMSPETPLNERGWEACSMDAICSQVKNTIRG